MTFVGGPFRHQLFWLGVNRAPAGWHKWTFDFDAEAGLEIFHNDHALSAVDSGKTGLRGFSAIAVWGDQGQGHEQTVWLDDLSATLGGPVRLVSASEANPYAERATNPAASRPVIIDTRENAPAAPPLTDLPLLEKVSQYGITWTFDKPARVGHFINGDWYVVGPVTIKAIDPRPLYGGEIARRELDQMNPDSRTGRVDVSGYGFRGNLAAGNWSLCNRVDHGDPSVEKQEVRSLPYSLECPRIWFFIPISRLFFAPGPRGVDRILK